MVSQREYTGTGKSDLNLISYTDFTYADKTNYLTGITHFSPLGTQKIGYTYDPWGNVISITDKDGNELSQESTVNETATTVADEPITKSATVDETTKDVGTATKIAFLNPIRYRSYYYDSETEWYYLKTRYYSPDMCRFINADSVVSKIANCIIGYNLFSYCFNNSIILDDSSGSWPKFVKNIANKITNAKNTIKAKINSPTRGAA